MIDIIKHVRFWATVLKNKTCEPITILLNSTRNHFFNGRRFQKELANQAPDFSKPLQIAKKVNDGATVSKATGEPSTILLKHAQNHKIT